MRHQGWAEGRILREADISFAVSDIDSRQFEKLYGIRPKLLPNGVDIDRFEQVTNEDVQRAKLKYGLDDRTLLFMGLYHYKPNKEGIDFLVKSVMPEMLQQYPEIKLAIIGSEVPYNKPWLIKPGIIQYEELPSFVKACSIGVAPIFSGSGTRLKILEYMAAGIPVVSTTKGAEGITVEDGQNILIADDADGFIEKFHFY